MRIIFWVLLTIPIAVLTSLCGFGIHQAFKQLQKIWRESSIDDRLGYILMFLPMFNIAGIGSGFGYLYPASESTNTLGLLIISLVFIGLSLWLFYCLIMTYMQKGKNQVMVRKQYHRKQK